jgi:hypothetical protein
MTLKSKPDRRQADRLTVPACAGCPAADSPLVAVVRTDYVVYFRCSACGHVTIVQKPEWDKLQRESGWASGSPSVVTQPADESPSSSTA